MAAAVAGHEDLALRLLRAAGSSASYLARYCSSFGDSTCQRPAQLIARPSSAAVQSCAEQRRLQV